MKKLMSSLILGTTFLATQASFAAPTSTWEGSGSVFDSKGGLISDYKLIVENTQSESTIQRDVSVTLADGKILKKHCSVNKKNEDGWTSDCDFGKGGGHCFGQGLCISYEEGFNGKNYASTIVMDSPKEMRLLRTELKDGQPVRFFRERLTKQ